MPADAGCAAGSTPCAGLHALPGTSGRACAGPSKAGQAPAWVTKNTIALSSSGQLWRSDSQNSEIIIAGIRY